MEGQLVFRILISNTGSLKTVEQHLHLLKKVGGGPISQYPTAKI